MNEYDVIKTEQVELGRFKILLDIISKNGKEYPYSYVEIKNSVAVLAKKGEDYIFINQYRHSIKAYTLEIPGGAIKEGDSPKQAAKRELKEETGFSALNMKSLGAYYPTVGVSNEKCYLFFADCGSQEKNNLEPLEKLSVQLLKTKEIEEAIQTNKIMHGMALVAWLKYKAGMRDVD